MHTHLRALALFFAVVFALSLGSCSRDDLFGWLTGNNKTEKDPLAPDSTRGDTTFYSYQLRGGCPGIGHLVANPKGVRTLATFDGPDQ